MQIRKSEISDLPRMLESMGFKRCGIIHVIEDNYPRIAYEKF